MKRRSPKYKCPICPRVINNAGHPVIAHLRSHVRDGSLVEVLYGGHPLFLLSDKLHLAEAHVYPIDQRGGRP
jgi:hypothetical protein